MWENNENCGGFFHNKALPPPAKLYFHPDQGYTEQRETSIEELACTLKGILHVAISVDIPLKIKLSYGHVSVV